HSLSLIGSALSNWTYIAPADRALSARFSYFSQRFIPQPSCRLRRIPNLVSPLAFNGILPR
ncbi:MAG: hypothetical protein ACP5O5_03810, partial [Fervidicoccaceae archaeon]